MINSQVKICGITSINDAEQSIVSGSDFLGFILYQKSKRYISYDDCQIIINHIHSEVKTVAVTVDPSNDDIDKINKTNFDYIQLHGNESIDRVQEIKSLTNCKLIKAFGIRNSDDVKLMNDYETLVDFYLLDAKPEPNEQPGGNAKSFDWDILKDVQFNCPYFLSGGLNPKNIVNAMNSTKTNFFDVSSGVESSPGIKDSSKTTKFIELIKTYEN